MALVAVLLAVYMVEGALWWVDPARGLPPHNVWKDGVRYNWGQPIRNNSYGFREREFVPKQDGEFRVMALGDSLTWGSGLPVSQRWTEVLAQYTGYSVWNLAVSGGPMVRHAYICRQYAPMIRPDRIVVAFCYNDTLIRGGITTPEKTAFDKRYGRTLARVRSVFSAFFLPHIGASIENAIRNHAYPGFIEAHERVYDVNSAQWTKFAQALRQIAEVADTCGCCGVPIFLSCNLGAYRGRPTDYSHPGPLTQRYIKWHQQAEDAARSAGYVVVDVRDEMAAHGPTVWGINRLDNHPNAALQRIYAEAVARVFKRTDPGVKLPGTDKDH